MGGSKINPWTAPAPGEKMHRQLLIRIHRQTLEAGKWSEVRQISALPAKHDMIEIQICSDTAWLTVACVPEYDEDRYHDEILQSIKNIRAALLAIRPVKLI